MADDKRFLGANDIAEILGCSASYAYNVIRQLNAEMKEKNYISIIWINLCCSIAAINPKLVWDID